MSLLMQALKKAEQTKQKQQSEAVLSLSPTDNHPAQDASVVSSNDTAEFIALKNQLHEKADGTVGNSAPNNYTSSNSSPNDDASLSLSLTQPELVNELENTLQSEPEQGSKTHFIEDIPPLTATNQTAHTSATQHEPFIADADLLSSPNSKSAHTQAADAVLDVATSKSMPRSEPESSMADKLHRPRIDPEQLRANAKADATLAAEQKKAQSVFSSKTLVQPSRKNWLIALSGVGLLMLAGFAYVYWQNKQLESRPSLLGNAANTAPTPIPEASTTAVAASVVAASSDATANVATNPADAAASSANETSTKSNSKPKEDSSDKANTIANERAKTTKDKETVPVDRSAKTSSGKLARNATIKANNLANNSANNLQGHLVHDANAIQIRKGNSGNQINPALSSAYQAFITGDTATAERQYQSVLVQEPFNRDALLGLAALALNQRDADKSGSFYGKLLELDPNDPDAIAGLTSLQQGDPAQSESRLKKALSMHPNASAILFALGNLYAQQARWSEAQQYYFRAYTTQSANPDYAFNLAVSLDRLNQSKLAKDYYQRALDAGQAGTGNFNRNKVQQRIADLDKALNVLNEQDK